MDQLFASIAAWLAKAVTWLFTAGMAGAVIALVFTLADIIRTFVRDTAHEG